MPHRSTRADLPTWAKEMASATPGIDSTAFERILEVQHDLVFNPDISAGEIVTADSDDTLVTGVWSLLPFSRGSVHLRSLNVEDVDRPVINPRFFSVPFDMQYFIAVGRLAYNFWAREPVKNIVAGFISPDEKTLPPDATQEQWESFARTQSRSRPIRSV